MDMRETFYRIVSSNVKSTFRKYGLGIAFSSHNVTAIRSNGESPPETSSLKETCSATTLLFRESHA